MNENKVADSTKQVNIDPILPYFGLAVACERPNLQLCKPKLLPLKTYSYIRMQIQQDTKANDD